MKHKNFEMICAKAENMDLVMFIKRSKHDKWEQSDAQGFFPLSELDGVQYFLCLPQHKDAVLHCLNGGKSQAKNKDSREWKETEKIKWHNGHWYMREDCESRIKPSKEKRWIAIRMRDLSVYDRTFESRSDALDELDPKYWDFYELEIEVTNDSK